MLFWAADHNEGLETTVVCAVQYERTETFSFSLMENVAFPSANRPVCHGISDPCS